MKKRVLSLITGAVIATSVTSANMSAIAASTLTAQDINSRIQNYMLGVQSNMEVD